MFVYDGPASLLICSSFIHVIMHYIYCIFICIIIDIYFPFGYNSTMNCKMLITERMNKMAVKFDFRQMVPISELHRKLGEISEKVSEQDVLVLKNNKPEFIIVAPDKYEELINALDLIEQLDIYTTVEKRREKPSLNGIQMLEKLKALESPVTTNDML